MKINRGILTILIWILLVATSVLYVARKNTWAEEFMLERDVADDNLAENKTDTLSIRILSGGEIVSGSDNIFYLKNEAKISVSRNSISREEKEILDNTCEALKTEYEGENILYYSDVYLGISKYDEGAFSEYMEMKDDDLFFSRNIIKNMDRQIFRIKRIASYKFYINNGGIKDIIDEEDVVKLVDITSFSDVYQLIFDEEIPDIKLAEEVPKGVITSGNIATILIEDNVGLKRVSFYRNGSLIEDVNLTGDKRITRYEYDAALIKDSDEEDVIRVWAEDLSGNTKEFSFEYKVDSSAPLVTYSGFENGRIYGGNASVYIMAEDNSESVSLFYRCDYTDPAGNVERMENATKEYNKLAEIKRLYDREGIYDISFFAYDENGNYSPTYRISFGVDNQSPLVSISNVECGKVYNESVSAYASVSDMFYEGLNVELQGIINDERGTKNINLSKFEVKSRVNKNIYSFSDEGSYVLSLKASDGYGHSACSASEFVIDKSAPEIMIKMNESEAEGDALESNTDVLSKIPEIRVSTSDKYTEYFANATIYKKEKDGSYKQIKASNVASVGKSAEFSMDVSSQGEYMVKVIATDQGGNTREKAISFIIDENPPVIGYVSNFNEKYLKKFCLPDNFSKYIQDATNIRYRAYLNSKEINNCDITKDGKYLLQVVAEDEAGNRSEEAAVFIVDNTKPRVIVKGLDNDGNIVKDGVISLSLFDSEDFFKEAFVNGKAAQIEENGREIRILASDYGDYDISVVASDYAGNEITQVVRTSCALSANPFTVKINGNDIKTLTKNEDQIHETFFDEIVGLKLYVFCGLLFSMAIGFIVFSLFDMHRIRR